MRRGSGIKGVRIDISVLSDLLREGNKIDYKVIKGLPKDAEFAYWYHAPIYGRDRFGTIVLVFISSEFEEVKVGDLIPELEIFMEKNL